MKRITGYEHTKINKNNRERRYLEASCYYLTRNLRTTNIQGGPKVWKPSCAHFEML